MIRLGYMRKQPQAIPDFLEDKNVKAIYSVASCQGDYFTRNWIDYWKHNGYWFYNTPEDIDALCKENNIDYSDTILFYYEGYELEFDFDEQGEEEWKPYACDKDMKTDVRIPLEKHLVGFDVVEYCCRNSAEDSLASCCKDIAVACTLNEYCLFDTFEEAKQALVSGIYHDAEPGPYRILAVYLIEKTLRNAR